jgi:hypothetical protein
MFNSLSCRLTSLKNDKAQFNAALRTALYIQSDHSPKYYKHNRDAVPEFSSDEFLLFKGDS